jgi:hypothetical protein
MDQTNMTVAGFSRLSGQIFELLASCFRNPETCQRHPLYNRHYRIQQAYFLCL